MDMRRVVGNVWRENVCIWVALQSDPIAKYIPPRVLGSLGLELVRGKMMNHGEQEMII